MEVSIERAILRNLLTNEDYMRKVLPFIQPEYFQETDRIIFQETKNFITKYNKAPTFEMFKIELDDAEHVTDQQYSSTLEELPQLYSSEETDQEWLMETTERWCQDRALFNAVMESLTIIDGKHKELTKNALPELLSTALSVSFDTNIGHDFIEAADDRYEYYHREEERIPFDIEILNIITGGGLPRKTLNVILAGTNVGKSMAMCHFASSNLVRGLNVLYITAEMAEEKIAERIDANLLDVDIPQIKHMSKEMFTSKVSDLKRKTSGKLIIKEYPTGQANAGHFRALLKELKLKKNFTPDIIYIDYLNICASSRMKGAAAASNSYGYIKAVAEELRGLAVENNLPIVTATQTNRSGFSNSDVGLEDTSESFGLPATADFMFALITTEELQQLGQLLIKQLKNRYADVLAFKKFVIGVDRAKMRLFDVNDDQQDLVNDTPDYDKASAGKLQKFENFKIDDEQDVVVIDEE